MTTIRTFFLQIRAYFSSFLKRTGETSPLPPPSSYTPVYKIGKYIRVFFILVGISSPCDVFEASKFFISLITFSFEIWLKVNTEPLLSFLFIAKILGCLRYFYIDFKVGSLTFSIIESVWSFLGIFRGLIIFEKKSFKTFASPCRLW